MESIKVKDAFPWWASLGLQLLNVLYILKSKMKSFFETKPLQLAKGGVKALTRDLGGLYIYLKFQAQLKYYDLFLGGLVNRFDSVANRLSNKIAIHHGPQKYRFKDLQVMTYQVGNWLEQEMPKVASVEGEDFQVGLMLDNTPETVALIMGVFRVKACPVMFNTHHRADILKNAFEATNCKMFIFESKYLSALRDIAHDLPCDTRFYMIDNATHFWFGDNIEHTNVDINQNIVKVQSDHALITRNDLIQGKPVDGTLGEVLQCTSPKPSGIKYEYSLQDHLLYLFTSGTTGGKIKATPMNTCRFIVALLSQINAFHVKEDDHFYISLPIFHAFPCVIGIGMCYLNGCTITLVPKFSASRFWGDCITNKCTVALYIGEIARYLLAQPESANDTKHSLRMMLGLGMNKEIWQDFTSRFNVKKVSEFYASSEGNVSLFNTQCVPGSCGFVPWYFGPLTRYFFPVSLIKVDPVTLEPFRSSNGLCKLCKPGDCGVIVGAIRKELYTKFLGYTSKEESSKKVIHNVLTHGDQAFMSGDLMEMDIYGNLYFRDRTGDTFRWKGENVSTTEVENIAAQYLNHVDCTVYGVSIPHTDGCAGMIAIKDVTARGRLEHAHLDALYAHMKTRLPEYAIPKFVRLTDQIETTSTHKVIKYRLRKQGFDLAQMKPNDRLFYFNKREDRYCLLDAQVAQDIANGNIIF